jgi:hypothetical protein
MWGQPRRSLRCGVLELPEKRFECQVGQPPAHHLASGMQAKDDSSQTTEEEVNGVADAGLTPRSPARPRPESKSAKKSGPKSAKKSKSEKPGPSSATTDSAPARKPKDPNAPKRPPTSYVLFCKDCHAEVLEEARKLDPKPTVKIISAILSSRWREVPAEMKEQYESKAKVFREEYYEKKRAYTPAPTDPAAPPPQKGKKRRAVGVATGDKRKRPKSAYIFFCNATRSTFDGSGLSATEVMSKLGSLWKALSPEDRIPYEAMARDEKELLSKQEVETLSN